MRTSERCFDKGQAPAGLFICTWCASSAGSRGNSEKVENFQAEALDNLDTVKLEFAAAKTYGYGVTPVCANRKAPAFLAWTVHASVLLVLVDKFDALCTHYRTLDADKLTTIDKRNVKQVHLGWVAKAGSHMLKGFYFIITASSVLASLQVLMPVGFPIGTPIALAAIVLTLPRLTGRLLKLPILRACP